MGMLLARSSDKCCRSTDERLLEAVLEVCAESGITPSEPPNRERPLLSLGALFSASQVFELSLPEYVKIGRLRDSSALTEVLKGVIAAAHIDLQDLADDAAQAVDAIDSEPEPLYRLLPRLTCEADWDRVVGAQFDDELILQALHSEAQFVAYLGCYIVESGACRSISGEQVKAILQAGGYGLLSASVLAEELWGEDAFAVISQRLRGRLTDDCSYLLKRIPELMPENADAQDTIQLLVRGIRYGAASVAVSAAEALERLDSLTPEEEEVRELLLYWKEHEAPYPVNGGAIPPSPRASLLRKLSRAFRVSTKEALEWLHDERTDVREVALSIMRTRLAEEPDDVEPLLLKICAEGEPLSLLEVVQDLPLEVLHPVREALLNLFSSRHAYVCRRMLESLPAKWLSREEAISRSEQLMTDEDPRVRSSALLALRRLRGTES